LEEYVYDTRSKLDSKYASYVQAAEKEKLLAKLSEAEEWLYSEEGEDATKSAYVERLDALRALGDPIATRWNEAEIRPREISALRESINTFLSQATSSDERWNHIDQKDKDSVVEKAATAQKWLDDNVARQAERPRNIDPILTSKDIQKKRDDLIYFSTPVFSKLKPKPPPSSTAPSGTATPQEAPAPEPAKNEPTEMDVD